MRNGVVVFVLVVPAAVVGIGNVSYGLRICRNGESFDLPLCALEEWWGERGTGKNPRLGFRILAASLATVLHLDLIFLCSFHTHSLDSDHTERHRGLWLMILGEKKQTNQPWLKPSSSFRIPGNSWPQRTTLLHTPSIWLTDACLLLHSKAKRRPFKFPVFSS